MHNSKEIVNLQGLFVLTGWLRRYGHISRVYLIYNIFYIEIVLLFITTLNHHLHIGISKKWTPLVQKKCPLYRDLCFIQFFSKIVSPQSKAIRSLSCCPSYEGVRFILCPLYRDSTEVLNIYSVSINKIQVAECITVKISRIVNLM